MTMLSDVERLLLVNQLTMMVALSTLIKDKEHEHLKGTLIQGAAAIKAVIESSEALRKITENLREEADKQEPLSPEHKKYITTGKGLRGFYAVMLHWSTKFDGFWEPLATGPNRYATRTEAMVEAKQWAEDEKLEFRP